MSEFMDQANRFIEKSKADGVDSNKIANTVRFMYSLTQQNIANNVATKENTGSIQYNADTGEYYNTLPGGSADVSTYMSPQADTSLNFSDFGITPSQNTSSQSTQPTTPAGFDFDSAATSFTYQSPKQEVSSQPAPNTSTNNGPTYSAPTKELWKPAPLPTISSLSSNIFGQKFK